MNGDQLKYQCNETIKYNDLYTVMKTDRCVLITGTIAPNVPDILRSDVQRRRVEYLDALRFYRAELDLPIFFLENSSFDVEGDEDFRQLFEQDIELVKFEPSEHPEKGKGYQEFEVLDHAIDQLSAQFTSIIKVTGRYKVENIKQLARHMINGIMADLHRKKEVAITGCFIADRKFYAEYIAGLYRKCNDENGDWIERVLYRTIKKQDLWEHVDLFPENPIYTGVPGSHSGTLERHPLKMKLRNAERKVLKALNMHEFPYEY